MVSMQVRDVDGIRTVDLTDWDDLGNLSNVIINTLGGTQ
jgi:hypothetical protein